MTTKFETFLNTLDEKDWLNVVDELSANIHAVDRDATQIWFRFFPLTFSRYWQNVEDKELAIQKFALQGNWELKDQIDSSHNFLCGHRFWKETKKAIEQRIESFDAVNGDLVIEAKQLAQNVANDTKSNVPLTLGISLVGLMTLAQVGAEALKRQKAK
ncbi:MAG: hypothetical protein HC846_04370 [Blastocatellia bacterium]|nr:hypothetical protein [Blastocatellia bacterium]